MSLTSYRAAPPRVRVLFGSDGLPRGALALGGGFGIFVVLGPCWEDPVLGRPGGDLLSHVLRRSTIGAEGFHGRVRDGIGCLTPRQSHQVVEEAASPASPEAMPCGSVHRHRLWTERPGDAMRSLCCVTCAGRPLASGAGRACRCALGRIKPDERLVPVGSTHCCASTPGLSTWWSTTALRGELVSRGVSRLDAFSGYPVRT